jgi:hypothetical protein
MTMFLEVKFEIGYFITTGIFTNCEYTRTTLGTRTTVYKYYIIIIGNETVTTKSQRVERKKSLVLKS